MPDARETTNRYLEMKLIEERLQAKTVRMEWVAVALFVVALVAVWWIN